jgi:hypothetical protein
MRQGSPDFVRGMTTKTPPEGGVFICEHAGYASIVPKAVC